MLFGFEVLKLLSAFSVLLDCHCSSSFLLPHKTSLFLYAHPPGEENEEKEEEGEKGLREQQQQQQRVQVQEEAP